MGNDYYNNTSKLVDFVLKDIDKDVNNEENINTFIYFNNYYLFDNTFCLSY